MRIVESQSPAPSPRGSADLMADLNRTEQRQNNLVRERNMARQALQSLLAIPSPNQLTAARKQREEIRALDEDLAILEEQRLGIVGALKEAQTHEAVAAWQSARQASEAAADKVRAAMRTYQRAIDAVVPLGLEVAKAEAVFADSLRPANGVLEVPVTARLNRLTVLRLHQLSNAQIRAHQVIESPYELEQTGRADFMRATEDSLVPALRCFDRKDPSHTSPPPEAA